MTPEWERGAGDKGGGFAALGALLRRVAGVSRLYWCNSPRLLAVRDGVAPKVQTTSTKNADNGVSWARWSALCAQRCPAWRVARTRTRYSVR